MIKWKTQAPVWSTYKRTWTSTTHKRIMKNQWSILQQTKPIFSGDVSTKLKSHFQSLILNLNQTIEGEINARVQHKWFDTSKSPWQFLRGKLPVFPHYLKSFTCSLTQAFFSSITSRVMQQKKIEPTARNSQKQNVPNSSPRRWLHLFDVFQYRTIFFSDTEWPTKYISQHTFFQ